jgi:membrane protein
MQQIHEAYELLAERFARNDILTYASAIARQLLISVVPIFLVAFLLVGVVGNEGVWQKQLGPAVADRTARPVYDAIDYVVEGLIRSTHAGWLLAGILLVIWELSGSVRATMGALNRIFELDETRSTVRRYVLSVGLAVPVGLLILGAMLVAARGGGWLDLGLAQPVWSLARWLLVLVLLFAVLALLIRFAPNGHQPPGIVTIGGVLVVVGWVAASVGWTWWAFSVASYKTPFGTAIAILTFVGYLYASSIVFLTGAQVDQLLVERGAVATLARWRSNV